VSLTAMDAPLCAATRLDTLGADVRGRFEAASLVDEVRAGDAARLVDEAGGRGRTLVGDRVLVLPSAFCRRLPRGRARPRPRPARAGRRTGLTAGQTVTSVKRMFRSRFTSGP
jgi:hypothetical protein